MSWSRSVAMQETVLEVLLSCGSWRRNCLCCKSLCNQIGTFAIEEFGNRYLSQHQHGKLLLGSCKD